MIVNTWKCSYWSYYGRNGGVSTLHFATVFRCVVVVPNLCTCITKRLVGLCYCGSSAASGGSYPPGCALWTVPFRYPDSSGTHWRYGRQFVPADSEGQEPHILHALLPDRRRSLEYELRPRSHDRDLVPNVNPLTGSITLLSFHVSWLFDHIVVTCCVLITSY